MGRRSGAGILMAIAKDVARQQRLAEAARVRAIREAEKQTRAAQREAERYKRECSKTLKEMERDQKLRYREAREQETTLHNEDIRDKLTALDSILPDTLSVNDAISFAELRILDNPPPFLPPEHLRQPRATPLEATYLGAVPVPSGIKAYVPGAKKRYDDAVMEAWKTYETDLALWRTREAQRIRELRALEERYARAVSAFEAKKAQRNAEVDSFEATERGC